MNLVLGLTAATGVMGYLLTSKCQCFFCDGNRLVIGDWSGAVAQASYHLPLVGSAHRSSDAWQAGNYLGAAGHAGLFGLEAFGVWGAGKVRWGGRVQVNSFTAKLTTNKIKLSQQLASGAQMPEEGIRIIEHLRSGPRLAKQYGGKASEWAKKSSSSFTTENGMQFETHWYENILTSQRVEVKTKLIKP